MYAYLFWIGFLVLFAVNVYLLTRGVVWPAIVGLLGTVFMFVGSKLGREFLGISS